VAVGGPEGGRHATSEAVIGMVVPPARDEVPAEASELYPEGVAFIARGLGLTELTPAAYARGLRDLEEAISRLVAQGAQAVSLMGTSITFFEGRAGHDAIVERMRRAAGGRPVSTMSLAITRALRPLGAQRIAVGSPYSPTVARALVEFLQDDGFEVVASEHLGLTEGKAIRSLGRESLVSLGDAALELAADADALLLSCGALHTMSATAEIEARWSRPVVSSSQAGCWDAVRLVAPGLAGPYRGVARR